MVPGSVVREHYLRLGRLPPGAPPGLAYLETEETEIRGPSTQQKKRMVALVVREATKEVFENHLYKFDGKVFRQKDGVPIGLQLTEVVARLVMVHWDRLFITKLEDL